MWAPGSSGAQEAPGAAQGAPGASRGAPEVAPPTSRLPPGRPLTIILIWPRLARPALHACCFAVMLWFLFLQRDFSLIIFRAKKVLKHVGISALKVVL